MKAYKTRILPLLILIVFLTSINSYAQNPSIEKVYTQTDRPFYFPGETIWFKSYITGSNNTISTTSDIAYAELISPKGAIVKTLKLSIKQGYTYGDFDIDQGWTGGIYTLKIYTNWMRNYGKDTFFTKKITVQKIVRPNLLLSLKFEEESYGITSQVVANFKVKDLKNNPLKNKSIHFEVSIKGEKIITKEIVTNLKGEANPSFILPSTLETVDVVLNILVPHNGTNESISRSVPIVLDNIDLQFFPESGKIITGLVNNIAFKALNEFGKPVDVKGDIIDSNGNLAATFNSFHNGMGSFLLTPKKGNTFFAKIKEPFLSDHQIELPKVYKKGVQFSVKTNALKTTLNVNSIGASNLFLEVVNASKQLLKQRVNSKEIELDTDDFPIGITKFRLLDENGNVLAERLVFINAHKQLNVEISLDKEIYNTREKVKATITTTDRNNNPIPSNLSIAIADNKLLSFADDKQDNILTYLLMSSELKGKLYKPNFYLNPKQEKSNKALDYVMLTHGWRNYINNNSISSENALFLAEQNAIQYGTVLDLHGNPIKAHLLLFDQKGNKVLVFDTKKDGTFAFKFFNNKSLTLIAYTDDKTSLKIIKNELIKGVTESQSTNLEKSNVFLKTDNPVKKVIKQKVTASIRLEDDAASLDEVVVTGYSTTTRSKSAGSISYIHSEELAHSNSIAHLLQGQVAGLQIQNDGFTSGSGSKIFIRGVASISGNSIPLYIVDGVQYNQNIISNLDPNQINTITVLKDGAATALYGSAAANGVIVVSTKNRSYFNNNWGKKKLNNAKFNNYAIQHFYNNNRSNIYSGKQFYIPKYDGEELPEIRADFRQTIYWNPLVQTDENGTAEVEFYNSDAITSFNITTEGIGYNGLVGRKEKDYSTKKLLSLDFKSPNYMVLNDTTILPITIINESENTIQATLDIKLPKHLKLIEEYDSKIIAKAKTTIIKNIKVIPIKKANNVFIKLALKSETLSDIVKRKVTIISPYFPTEVSISGSKSQIFNFDINSIVDGSLKAQFNIYTDIVGDVMDGIEGIIRKPYGCFEQTSSSTYPNIMVLKYLKESGKDNPEIEAKAINFIKEGYKRLISFETNHGGFEWFGHTPPHETLTAYGILEFIEMKDVYDGVDQKMIDRTVKWLLSRKDGKGGFKKSKKGYDSFASSPLDVANAYIIYALSEANINADFSLEYTKAYTDAIKSNDNYKMSLLALSSYNLSKTKNAKLLIAKIKENIERYSFKKLPVANTITRSYGNAKNIETLAFTLLALMRENSLDEALIARGVEYLISQRKHNTFGSTQSTAMALKALIEYTKNNKRKIISNSDFLKLVINGKTLNKKLQINKNGKIVIDNLSSYLREGNQNVRVNFTNPEITFPFTLNVKWDSYIPDSSKECVLKLETTIEEQAYKVGDNVSLNIKVSNSKNEKLSMATAIIGIPSGATVQPWQLKELLEQQKVAYYEVFDNYLVFYWRAFNASETKIIRLDLKADIAGNYNAPASTAYLYYGDEHKTWISGNELQIKN